MSRVLAGPFAAQVLADLGAEVIKIEQPGKGDVTRRWGPPFHSDDAGRETGTAAYYYCANRGKKSVTVNLAVSAGQEIIRKLAVASDVLLENFRTDKLAEYGLDYSTLQQHNPQLVYCSITGFGHTGPYRERPGYDLLIQAMAGVMSVTGSADGPPLRAGISIADLSAGLFAVIAIQGALLERERSGLGQHIDLSLFDAQTAMLANQAAHYLVGGEVPGRLGSQHPNIVPYQAFATSEGYIILAIASDEQFARFAAVAGAAELARDERFATNAARVRNRAATVSAVGDLLKQRPGAEWIELLSAASIPAGPINNIAEVFDNPQVKARDMCLELSDPVTGPVQLPGSPLHYSRSDSSAATTPPPAMGADTDSVLSDLLGLDKERLTALRDKGVI
ncbi:MAG: CoA transferase [Gammaproteobacteria bacterium]|nr:CoA transferase [Gammaproteobacteria bacterium]NNF61806.1 CoA transferase [Gammaproteobacteria bacterium]NNM19730.1 CoA transferase [Gammaproteobacteria bacterium]